MFTLADIIRKCGSRELACSLLQKQHRLVTAKPTLGQSLTTRAKQLLRQASSPKPPSKEAFVQETTAQETPGKGPAASSSKIRKGVELDPDSILAAYGIKPGKVKDNAIVHILSDDEISDDYEDQHAAPSSCAKSAKSLPTPSPKNTSNSSVVPSSSFKEYFDSSALALVRLFQDSWQSSCI